MPVSSADVLVVGTGGLVSGVEEEIVIFGVPARIWIVGIERHPTAARWRDLAPPDHRLGIEELVPRGDDQVMSVNFHGG